MSKNNIVHFKPELSTRLISALFYLTMGIFAVVYLLYKGIKKEYPTSFQKYHCIQSIFIMLILSICGYVVNIVLGFLYVVPFINTITESIVFYTTVYDLILHFSVMEIVLIGLIIYASVQTFRGLYTEIPIISGWVRQLV